MDGRRFADMMMTVLSWAAALLLTGMVVAIIGFVVVRGYSVLSLDFLIEPPRDSMTRGGIMTPLVGT